MLLSHNLFNIYLVASFGYPLRSAITGLSKFTSVVLIIDTAYGRATIRPGQLPHVLSIPSRLDSVVLIIDATYEGAAHKAGAPAPRVKCTQPARQCGTHHRRCLWACGA